MASSPLKSTSKRKRGEEPEFAPLVFSFDLSAAGPPEDGSSSPRSSVAHKFRGLMLGSGGGVNTVDSDDMDMDTNDSVRKRHKPDEVMHDALQLQLRPQSQPQSQEEPAQEPETVAGPSESDMGDRIAPLQLDVPLPSTEGSLQNTYPSINRLSESKSKARKRAGTPPLRLKKGQLQEGPSDADDESEVVDPVRAALTWHEDEITIYDPDDEDDDGTGINGIGFKPTPALAHARVMKRRQQMAEYRKREESEARARRSQRRRGEALPPARRDNKSPSSRRVRFMDAERRNNIAVTTGGC